jgi:hypothetical protein
MRWRRDPAEDDVAAVAEEPPEDLADEDEKLPCARCGTGLRFLGEQDFRAGSGMLEFVLGDLGDLIDGSTRMEMWVCQSCGHLEFFMPGIGE